MDIMQKNANTYTIVALKKELKALGAKTSGSKTVLIERLNTWKSLKLNRTLYEVNAINRRIPSEQNDVDQASNIDPGNPDREISYQDIDNDDCDIRINQNNDNVTNEIVLSTDLMPLCAFDINIFNFLSVSLITEWFITKFAKASLDKGFRLAQHNFIVRIFGKLNDSSQILIAGKCFAEMSKHKTYTVKLVFQNEAVVSSNCECVAGSGYEAACKHVSAIMFGLQHYGSTGKSLERVSPTSRLQICHQPTLKKNCEKMKINDHLKPPKPIQPEYVTQYNGHDKTSDLHNLFINYKETTNFNMKFNANPVAYFEDHRYVANLEKITLDAINQVTEVERKAIQMKTSSQRLSKSWLDLRKSRITASNAYNVVTTVRSKRFSDAVAKNILRGSMVNTPAIRWGIKFEAKALRAYENKSGVKVNPVGLCIDSQFNFLAASPDGITEDGQRVIEIKCPYAIRKEKTLENLSYIRNGTLKKNHKYFLQCQLQMRVTDIKVCDFVVWIPHEIFIFTINYDEAYVTECIGDIEEYYTKIFCKKYMYHKWN